MKEITIASVKDSAEQINTAMDEKFVNISREIASSVAQRSVLSEEDLSRLIGSQSNETKPESDEMDVGTYKELLKSISLTISQNEEISKQNKEILTVSKQMKEELFNRQLNFQQETSHVVDDVQELIVNEPDDSAVVVEENSIDIPHTSVLILATLALCLYGFLKL